MADRAPRVSVLVPAYGVAAFLGEALASLQAQRMQDWEAVVVDDGSPDDVAAAFAPFASDRRLRLLMTDNRGVSTARNRAAAAARAPFLSLLDGDDQYAPDYLDRMLGAMEADPAPGPALGFVGCDATVFGARQRTGARYSDRYRIAGPISLERVLRRETCIFTAATLRRRAFDEVGGFDGALAAAEDLDLWIRLLAAGWSGAVLPQALVRYRRRPGSLSSSERRLLANSVVVYRKATVALEGRPQRAEAERQQAACEQGLRWLDGEALILAGDPAAALPLLDGAEQRSRRWRLVMPLLRRAPRLAAFLFRSRAIGSAWPGGVQPFRRRSKDVVPRGSAIKPG